MLKVKSNGLISLVEIISRQNNIDSPGWLLLKTVRQVYREKEGESEQHSSMAALQFLSPVMPCLRLGLLFITVTTFLPMLLLLMMLYRRNRELIMKA